MQIFAFALVGLAGFEQLGPRRDDGQGIVDFVRGPGRQLTHRSQPFGLQELQIDLLIFPQGVGQFIGAQLEVVEKADPVQGG